MAYYCVLTGLSQQRFCLACSRHVPRDVLVIRTLWLFGHAEYRIKIFRSTNIRKNIPRSNYKAFDRGRNDALSAHRAYLACKKMADARCVEKLFHLMKNVFHYGERKNNRHQA